MHKVSTKMQSDEIIRSVTEICAALPTVPDKQYDTAQRHGVVQQVLVNEVYLGGEPSLVEECGFGTGEKGYAQMQMVMAEHQNDPMVGQYIGNSKSPNSNHDILSGLPSPLVYTCTLQQVCCDFCLLRVSMLHQCSRPQRNQKQNE
jgi:hypothetical protein